MCPFHRKPALTAKAVLVEKEAHAALDEKRRSGANGMAIALGDAPPAYHQLNFGSEPVSLSRSPSDSYSHSHSHASLSPDSPLLPLSPGSPGSTLLSPDATASSSPTSLKPHDPCAWGHDTRPSPAQAVANGALHVALFPFSLFCEKKHLKCRNCGVRIERRRVQQ